MHFEQFENSQSSSVAKSASDLLRNEFLQTESQIQMRTPFREHNPNMMDRKTAEKLESAEKSEAKEKILSKEKEQSKYDAMKNESKKETMKHEDSGANSEKDKDKDHGRKRPIPDCGFGGN